jgi:hypothetical protein
MRPSADIDAFSVRQLPPNEERFRKVVGQNVCNLGGHAVIPTIDLHGRWVQDNKAALTNPLPLWTRNLNERYNLSPRIGSAPPAAGGRHLTLAQENELRSRTSDPNTLRAVFAVGACRRH